MYTSTMGKVDMVDWDSAFIMTVLGEYHEVIPMKQFMEEQAEQIWPVGKRTSF